MGYGIGQAELSVSMQKFETRGQYTEAIFERHQVKVTTVSGSRRNTK